MDQSARKAASFLILLVLHLSWVPYARAGDFRDRVVLSEEVAGAAGGAEYASGRAPGALLMTVNLWGSVGRPGVHHIPLKTDLATLLSLAGGPVGDADLSNIIIRRGGGDKSLGEVQEVNFKDLLSNPKSQSPVLSSNDIILVPQNRPFISPNATAALGLIASLAGIILSGVAISLAFKK